MENIKTFISKIITENCSFRIEKGSDSLGDFWIDFTTKNKDIAINYISEKNIRVYKNPDIFVYGEGTDKIFSSEEDAINYINF